MRRSLRWVCLESRYKDYLSRHLEHLGKKAGDLTQMALSDMERPVSPMGWKRDARADVFLSVVRMVVALIKTGDLYATCVENVRGILHKPKSAEASFMEQPIDVMTTECPEFHWQVRVLQATEYLLAQQRTDSLSWQGSNGPWSHRATFVA